MAIRQKVIVPISTENSDDVIKSIFYSFDDFDEDNEHILIEFTKVEQSPFQYPLLRVHSECLTGDLFHSHLCDCGDQLRESMAMLQTHGGYLIYLRQEGRGIGLYNKLDSYALQAQGVDTFDANVKLGFGEDEREYDPVVKMLGYLGVQDVVLITNNPSKVAYLQDHGITVHQRVATSYFEKPHNQRYLRAKAEKHGHLFDK